MGGIVADGWAEKKCGKGDTENVCGTGMKCALWVYAGDDREYCVPDAVCDTWGRWVGGDQKDMDGGAIFSLTCAADPPVEGWAKTASDAHTENTKTGGKWLPKAIEGQLTGLDDAAKNMMVV